VIGQHGGTLEAAYRTYRSAEEAMVHEITAIVTPGKAG
jgi:hypothetical protein